MELKVLASGSKGNCYLLQSKEETLIIECGIPYKEILKGLNFNLSNVVGCLITHSHKDHSKALQDMLRAGIDVYTSFETVWGNVKEEEAIETHHRLKFIKSEEQFTLGNFTVLPFETEHDCEGSLGFLIYHKDIGKLIFATDTYYVQYKFKGLNHIMVECNYANDILQENIDKGLIPWSLRNRLIKSHFSLDNVKEFLKANDLSQVQDITLIHLSDGNSNAERFKEEIERLTGKPTFIADKGLVIDLGG